MIYVYNEYEEIIETFNGPDHMYAVMNSRYRALQNKRYKDLNKAFNQGFMYGSIIATCVIVSIVLIFQLF